MAAPIRSRMKRWIPGLRSVYWTWRRYVTRSCCCHQNRQEVVSPGTSIDQPPFYITTPIFYVNAAPHIGHLYTALLADVVARWQRLKGRQTVCFSVGTDEHGLKIQQAAEKAGASPSDYCDRVSQQFKDLFDQTNISYDDFIRTTQPRHYEAVQTFWETLSRRGHIYKGGYEGWYCVSDEAFLTEEEVQDGVTPDGQHAKVSVASGQPVVWMTEENYMFRLTAFRKELTSWLDSKAVQPPQFESLVRSWLDDLRDLSVSRQRQRLSWGIPVPGDTTQTVYVWLDALVSYLTVAGYPHNLRPGVWPPACQVIGKDILRFHAVYWPAFLLAAGMSPPRLLLCHSHWLVDGHKMSKSRGNIVDPLERLGRYSADGLRYFLLREGSLASDGNYSDARAVERINSELVNSLGNLLSRTTAPSVNRQQEFPPMVPDSDLRQYLSESDLEMYWSLQRLPEQVDELYERFAFPRAIDLLMGHVHWANALVQLHQPWTLVKAEDSDGASRRHLGVVLHVAMETLRVCGVLLQPLVPQLADRLLTRLGVCQERRGLASVGRSVEERAHAPHSLGGKVTLLGRIRVEK
ncbi:methionine--tRNA ligase, mitochondrial-like [Babylonia areolata]|uniref:methionine--tRNA ligase, mitochondrial-like n=1 Tax=Babylonia areolata TaxID=304850 RepID=UPI003FCFA339